MIKSKTIALVAAAGFALASCQSTPKSTPVPSGKSAALLAMEQVAIDAHKCGTPLGASLRPMVVGVSCPTITAPQGRVDRHVGKTASSGVTVRTSHHGVPRERNLPGARRRGKA